MVLVYVLLPEGQLFLSPVQWAGYSCQQIFCGLKGRDHRPRSSRSTWNPAIARGAADPLNVVAKAHLRLVPKLELGNALVLEAALLRGRPGTQASEGNN